MRKSVSIVFILVLMAGLLLSCNTPTSSPQAQISSQPETSTPQAQITSQPQTSTPKPQPSSQPETSTPKPTNPPTTTTEYSPEYGWAFEGEVMRGTADATTVALPDGSYRMYYGSFSDYSGPEPGQPFIGSATSEDGLTWTDEGDRGLFGGWPRVIRLQDGRYRMYYGNGGTIDVAVSTDGLTWMDENFSGLEFTSDRSCSGLDVVTLPDGTFRMYYSVNLPSAQYTMTGVSNIVSATSNNGLAWQEETGVRVDYSTQENNPFAQHPRVIRLSDGSYRMFYWNANQTIWSSLSTDGINWNNHQPEYILGADPDIVVLPDGRLRMYANLYNKAMYGNGKDSQRMWSYVWDSQPYIVSAPTRISISQGKSATEKIKIVGVAGTQITLETILYTGLMLSDPPTITLSQSSGTVPFTVDLVVSNIAATSGGTHGIIINVSDGNVQTRQVITLSIITMMP